MNKISVTKKSYCRVCGDSNLKEVLFLSQCPFTDEFKSSVTENEFLYDIRIYICSSCQIAQTQHDVDIADYYSDYEYAVGNSRSAQNFMAAVAKNTKLKFFSSNNTIKVLEIGSGDGAQLENFRNEGFEILGFEPSEALCKISLKKNVPTIQGLFKEDAINQIPEDFRDLDLVFMSYTFDHIPEPMKVLEVCRNLLEKKNGLLIFEVHNLADIYARNEFCLFEHEHSIYLDDHSVIALLKLANFKLIDLNLVETNLRRANSLIVVAALSTNQRYFEFTPSHRRLATRDVFDNLQHRIDMAIQNIDGFLQVNSSKGKRIVGYGAGGRGIMSVAPLKNAHLIDSIYDMNPKGENIFSPKTNIPILHAELLTSDDADIVIVFSFGYIEEISDFLQSKGFSKDQIINLKSLIQTHE